MAASEEAREGVKEAALEWVRNQRKLAAYQEAIATTKGDTSVMEETADILSALGEFGKYVAAWDTASEGGCKFELVANSAHPSGRKHCLTHNTYYAMSESCPNG